MERLKAEISETKSKIETARRELDGMLKDYSLPMWKPIEKNRTLTELAAYLKGLECQTEFSSVETTVTLSSSASAGCKECKSGPGFNSTLGDRIDHYLKHGYRLLYFGQDTRADDEGNPWHSIVAVLGKEKQATRQISASGAA